MSAADRAEAWWRQPIVWLLIAIPASSIAVGVAFAVVSFRVFDGVVVDDYYEQGRAINRVLARDAEATRLGLAATVALDSRGDGVEVRLAGGGGGIPPAALRLSLLHATRAGNDRVVEVTAGADGVYRGEVAPLAPGRHEVQLEAASWRLVGSLTAPAETSCALAPAR